MNKPTKKGTDKKQKAIIDNIIDEATVDAELLCSETKTKLASHVKNCFIKSENSRKEVEDGWLDSLRQYRGVYSPEVLAKIHKNRSKANIRVTRTKVRTIDSRLIDLLFPSNGEKNWSIERTPLPQMSPDEMKNISMMYAQETGQEMSPAELELALTNIAREKATKMSRVIEDQLSELKYREIMRNVLHSGNLYGTGVLKGPLVSITENQQYTKKKGSSGKERWILQENDKITPFIEHVRTWDVYPDMDSDTLDSCRFIIQRRKMDKHALVSLGKRSDFSNVAIRDYLERNPNGNYTKKNFETSLSNLGDIVDSAKDSVSKKYEVLEFWGYVDAQDLKLMGVDIPECKDSASIELMANIWVVGDTVIKSSLSPMDGVKFPYFFYYYDKDETSIFGQGIPSIMKDVQELINSAFRAMLDNAAISAGPQVEVNLSLLSEDEDPTDFYPFKVWMRTGEGSDATSPAIRTLQFQSYTTEFERMIELFRNYGDEITSIPRFMWGEGTNVPANNPAAMSMLLGSANITIKDQVKNFDDGITKPFITAMYHWNMQFHEDESAKGDFGVVARGSSSLVAKEIRSQNLMTFASLTANPMDQGVVKRTELLRSISESLDLEEVNLILTDQEIQIQQEQQAKAAEEERAFMTQIIETARTEGTSPAAMMDALKGLQNSLAGQRQEPNM